MVERVILKRGNYEGLLSFGKARIIYQGTVRFCERFLKSGDRTFDQMVQAARSGKQNILEGSKAASTSTEIEIKLTNVARASLEELLEDYCDFLKVRALLLWPKDSVEAIFVRKKGASPDASCDYWMKYIESRSAEVAANILICLIHQTNYLLDRYIQRLEADFLETGGVRERMNQVRRIVRGSGK